MIKIPQIKYWTDDVSKQVRQLSTDLRTSLDNNPENEKAYLILSNAIKAYDKEQRDKMLQETMNKFHKEMSDSIDAEVFRQLSQTRS
jgi:hypothetical protein